MLIPHWFLLTACSLAVSGQEQSSAGQMNKIQSSRPRKRTQRKTEGDIPCRWDLLKRKNIQYHHFHPVERWDQERDCPTFIDVAYQSDHTVLLIQYINDIYEQQRK